MKPEFPCKYGNFLISMLVIIAGVSRNDYDYKN